MKRQYNKTYGLSVAQELEKKLQEKQYPIHGVFLFGSFAKGNPREWSDIDIAIICDPFLASKYEERDLFSEEARHIDIRTEIVCLHPQDLQNKYFTLAKEVERHGIAA